MWKAVHEGSHDGQTHVRGPLLGWVEVFDLCRLTTVVYVPLTGMYCVVHCNNIPWRAVLSPLAPLPILVVGVVHPIEFLVPRFNPTPP